MATAGEIIGVIKLKTDQTLVDLGALERVFVGTFERIGHKITDAITGAISSTTRFIKDQLVSAFDISTDINEQIAYLRNNGVENIEAATEACTNLAMETGTSLVSVFGMYADGLRDLRESEIAPFVIAADQLADVLKTDTTDAFRSLTSIQKAYGLGVEDLTNTSNVLYHASKLGRSEMNAMASALITLAPAAKKGGVSLEEVASKLAAMTRTGLDAGTAALSMRSALVAEFGDLADAAKEAENVVTGMGTEFMANVAAWTHVGSQAMGNWQVFIQSLKEIAPVLPDAQALGITLDDIQKSLATLEEGGIPADEAIQTVLASIDQLTKMPKKLQESMKAAGITNQTLLQAIVGGSLEGVTAKQSATMIIEALEAVGISGLKTAKKFQTDINPQLNSAMGDMSDTARAMSYNVVTKSEEGLAAIDEFFEGMEDESNTLAEASKSIDQTYNENMSKLSALIDTIKYYVLTPFVEALTQIAIELAAWFKTDEGKEWLEDLRDWSNRLATNLKEFVKRGFAEGKSFGEIISETIIMYLKSVLTDSGLLEAAEDVGIAIGQGMLKGIAQSIKSFVSSAGSGLIDVVANSMLAWADLIDRFLGGGGLGASTPNQIEYYYNPQSISPAIVTQSINRSGGSPGSVTIINQDRRYSNGELTMRLQSQLRLGWAQLAREGIMS